MENVFKNISAGRLIGYLVLCLFVAYSLLPLWVALKTAFTYPKDIFPSAAYLFPTNWTLGNFARVLGFDSDIVLTSSAAKPINFALALRNSLIYTLVATAGQLFFSSLAAYAFARLTFPGRNFFFTLILASTMIPAMVLFIPNFVLIRQLGWLNTFQGMIAPGILMIPFAVFFMRQFFLSAPRELEEAARLDGASQFRIFWSIALPLQKGPVATLGILLSIGTWNDFFWPFLVGRQENVRVMAVALNDFLSQTGKTQPDWAGLMAAVAISIIPILILLIVFGKQIVESLQSSGGK